MKPFHLSAVLLLVTGLSACTPKIMPEEITPPLDSYQAAKKNAALGNAVSVGQVTIAPAAGGADGLVSSKSFAAALQGSLALNGYLAPAGGKPLYSLDASLDKIDADSFGVTMNTAVSAGYTLHKIDSGAAVFRSTIAATASSGWSDSISGQIRSRTSLTRALEGTMTQLIAQLATADLAPLPVTAPATAVPAVPAEAVAPPVDAMPAEDYPAAKKR